jgi:hypothetical protein
MKKCLQMLTLTAAVFLWGFAATEAKAGLVTADRGTFTYTLTSTGGTSGSAVITFTGATLTGVINGGVPTAVSIASVMSPLSATYSELTGPPPTGSYTFSFASTGTKDFGAPPADALLTYTTSTAGTNVIGSFNINGTMPKSNPVVNALPGLDFSPFSNGGFINLTLSDVGVDIGLAIVTGGTFTGTGAFTEVASSGVPEPGSLALLGIGMTGFLAFRRYFKKTSVA